MVFTAKSLISSDKDNLNHIAIFIHLLHVNNQLEDAVKYLNEISNIEEKCNLHEGLCVSVTQLFFTSEDLDNAQKYVNIGLKNFSDSVSINQIKGLILMLEMQEGGSESRKFDIVPFFFKSHLAEEATKYFKKHYLEQKKLAFLSLK